MSLFAREILETCLYVDDLSTARHFYTTVLGLTASDEQPGRHLFLRCGQRMLLLFIAEACAVSGGQLPPHGTHGAGHCAFAARESEFDDWPTHLKLHGVPIETTIDWPGGGRSLYFRDPSGNSLEIATPKLWGLEETRTIGS